MRSFEREAFPKAIIHVDGDSFFASCEVARNPGLRDKPVITGQERGIASSLTYEAKARGVKRGMSIFEIKRICPDAVILPSDYETYSLYSQRMYDIVGRYTEDVDRYSIDECFADLTGLRRPLHMSYEKIAEQIKKDLDSTLGITFSVGLSINKVLAKIASKWQKPSGLTIISNQEIDTYLKKSPVAKLWGIGPNTSAYLNKFGIYTAFDFSAREEVWVNVHLSKPFQDIWRELRGEFVLPLNTETKHDYQSISKTRTFTPPSNDKDFIFSQLSKNVENACIKLRRHGLYTKEFFFYLKTQDFRHIGLNIKLDNSVCIPELILGAIRERFGGLYKSNIFYRATGIVLSKLHYKEVKNLDLFGRENFIESVTPIYKAVDSLAERFGKHVVFLGSSFRAMKEELHKGERGAPTDRRGVFLTGETLRKHINIPILGKVK